MQDEKERKLWMMEAEALREARFLAGEFARAAAADREAILAALEFEQWFASSCRFARKLNRPP